MSIIALIVSKPFSYSETFFQLDVWTWKRLGYHVTVLPTKQSGGEVESSYFASFAPQPLSQNYFVRIYQLLWSFLRIMTNLQLLKTSIRFIIAEWEDGRTLHGILRRLYANQHILKLRAIDILIFGYANLAVTRENLGKALNAQTVVSFKGADISIFPHQSTSDIYKDVLQRNFLFYFVSKGLRSKACNLGFSKVRTSYIIPAYIDKTTFPVLNDMVSNEHSMKLVAVGRLHWKKGHIYLLLAMKILYDQGLKVQLQLIGDGEQYEQLFWACKTLELLNQVTFTGSLSHKDTLQQMNQSDLLVHPSLSEGTPNVVLEALYLRLPCIVTNWPGAEEIITHQWNGWITNRRSPEALANQIAKSQQISETDKMQITDNGKATIEDTFNASTQEAAFQRLLADALPDS